MTLLFASTVYRVPEWGNATLVEIAWTALGLFGVASTAVAALAIYRDRRIFYSGVVTGDPDKIKAARLLWRSHVRREALRCLQMAMIAGVGVWAMTQPSLTHPSVTTVTGLTVTGIFLAFVSITVVQSIQDSRLRHALIEILGPSEIGG